LLVGGHRFSFKKVDAEEGGRRAKKIFLQKRFFYGRSISIDLFDFFDFIKITCVFEIRFVCWLFYVCR